MKFQDKMQPLYMAGMIIGAPAMPEYVIGMCALVLMAASGWMFYKNRKK